MAHLFKIPAGTQSRSLPQNRRAQRGQRNARSQKRDGDYCSFVAGPKFISGVTNIFKTRYFKMGNHLPFQCIARGFKKGKNCLSILRELGAEASQCHQQARASVAVPSDKILREILIQRKTVLDATSLHTQT